jgi:hypothetical protein
MTDDQRAAMLYLAIGIVAGSLSDPKIQAALTESLHTGGLHPEYVRLARDKLTEALEASAS